SASYYFYMCWNPAYIILIIASTIIDFYAARQIEAVADKGRKKLFLMLSLCSNLGILFFFKYFNFFSSSVNSLFQQFNIMAESPILDILLPVGISFYTFQTLSYTIDVYRGEKSAETHLGYFALYVSFFPQLVAGPIERSTRLMPDLKEHKTFKYENLSRGIKLIIWGFFMKLVIADRASIYVNAVYNNPEEHGGITFIAATILFAFQIYGDFAGYSSIAIGSARIMGYDLMQNFNRPYFATNIRDFWRRWHISLSTWFRDYLYIPLGGNRVVKWRWYMNLFLTFLISGLWHGANWTFVIWGAIHGVFLVISTMRKEWSKKRQPKPKVAAYANGLASIPGIISTNVIVLFAWIFFRANNVQDAFTIIGGIFTNPGELFIPGNAGVAAPLYAGLGILLLWTIEAKREFYKGKFSFFKSENQWVRMFAYALLVVLIVFVGVFDGGQFIYFQF
ncbi:MAG: MBOAT family O-acyltransferase, partial [Bacteroidota bacterium]